MMVEADPRPVPEIYFERSWDESSASSLVYALALVRLFGSTLEQAYI